VGAVHLTSAWAAGEAPDTSGDTRQIIVALIGALALVLVALVPVFVTMAKRDAATTTPPAPAPAPSPPDELQRIWTAIEELRRDDRDAARDLSGHDALLDECQRDARDLDAKLERVRDEVHRHVWGPGHGTGS
jgi:hypothetical protein